jgi:hypothetical protein
MKLRLILVLLACAVPSSAQTFVATANGTSLPLTITSTGAAHLVILVVDSSTAPSSCTVGSQSAIEAGTSFSNSFSKLTAWFVSSSTGSQTSTTCSGAGTVNAAYEYEYSGMITTASVLDWGGGFGTNTTPGAFCNTTSSHPCTVYYTPSTANEAVVAAINCSGSGSTLTGSTWLHTSFPSGEGGGTLTTSSIALVTLTTSAGCNSGSGMGGIIVGFRASGGTATTCSSTMSEADVSAPVTGTNPSASITAQVHNIGDLFVIAGWSLSGSPGSTATLGSQTSTATTVSGTSSSVTGQPGLSYILATSASGSQTLTLTSSGGATQSQVGYREFTPNPGCSFTHDVDSNLGTGSSGTAINTPSITPSGAGELLFVFSAVSTHVASVNSPWSCTAHINETNNDCTYALTVNADGYILSGASGATANNMTASATGSVWEALITSFQFPSTACANLIALLGAGCR